jgi:hypothetical protein
MDIQKTYEGAKADAKTNYFQTATQATVDFRKNLWRGTRELRDWLLTPPPPEVPTPVRTSYCYSAFQDVLCYRQPVPGWEHRLVAYQGTNAAPPPVAVTQELKSHASSDQMLPQNRVANAKPVFVTIPPEVKGTESAKADAAATPPAAAEAVVDPAHETLPNPALAPQL